MSTSSLDRETQLTGGHALVFSLVAAALVTGLIALLGPFLTGWELTVHRANFWYRWQLQDGGTTGALLSRWGFYFAHQFSMWALIYYAQRQRSRYTATLHGFNVAALGLNFLFALVHIAQTHIWYDALAQDLHETTSFGSVTIMLVLVLIMEAPRRGLFWGRPTRISSDITDFLKRYHGYFFSLAITYTFWYHPAEDTTGHLMGFFYTFMLMIQGSLFFTRMHVNKWWKVSLETIVLVHGTVVASTVPATPAPMFAFGFLLIFVVTQMHGLGFSARTRWALLATYVVGTVGYYSIVGIEQIVHIFRVPSFEYMLLPILLGILWVGLKLFGRGTGGAGSSGDSSDSVDPRGASSPPAEQPS